MKITIDLDKCNQLFLEDLYKFLVDNLLPPGLHWSFCERFNHDRDEVLDICSCKNQELFTMIYPFIDQLKEYVKEKGLDTPRYKIIEGGMEQLNPFCEPPSPVFVRIND